LDFLIASQQTKPPPKHGSRGNNTSGKLAQRKSSAAKDSAAKQAAEAAEAAEAAAKEAAKQASKRAKRKRKREAKKAAKSKVVDEDGSGEDNDEAPAVVAQSSAPIEHVQVLGPSGLTRVRVPWRTANDVVKAPVTQRQQQQQRQVAVGKSVSSEEVLGYTERELERIFESASEEEEDFDPELRAQLDAEVSARDRMNKTKMCVCVCECERECVCDIYIVL
jgi:hypothetical protein